MRILYLIVLITTILSIKGHTQTIIENTSYPRATRAKCEYQFIGGGGIYFDYWMPPTNSVVIDNSASMIYLYLKWKNVEASAGKSMLQARYHDSQNHPIDVTTYVGPFQLSFPNPTFVGGATRNIPCYSTDPITISLNPYNNTADNGIDKDTEITSHFRWTLPPGWISSGGKTGTFDAYSSLTVIPPVSSSNTSIQVQPYADAGQGAQYGPTVSLQITRNLEAFSITGPTSVVYNTTNRYTVPSYPGISYSWQLPAGWSGSSTTNYIDVTPGCGSGTIVSTMTGCSGSKPSQISITTNIIESGTTISGQNIVCSSGTQFTVPGLISGTNITWNASANLTPSNASANYITYSANSNGQGWIEATINAPACGTSVLLTRKPVWLGPAPVPSNIYGFENNGLVFGQNSVYEFTAYPDDSNFDWMVYGGTILSGQGTNQIAVRTATNPTGATKYFDIRVRAGNSCGWSDYLWRSGYIGTGIGPASLIISPNPSTNETTISLPSENNDAVQPATGWDLDVYDSFQGLKEKKTKLKTNETKINTSGWKEGVYIIRATIGDKVLTEKMLVKH